MRPLQERLIHVRTIHQRALFQLHDTHSLPNVRENAHQKFTKVGNCQEGLSFEAS